MSNLAIKKKLRTAMRQMQPQTAVSFPWGMLPEIAEAKKLLHCKGAGEWTVDALWDRKPVRVRVRRLA